MYLRMTLNMVSSSNYDFTRYMSFIFSSSPLVHRITFQPHHIYIVLGNVFTDMVVITILRLQKPTLGRSLGYDYMKSIFDNLLNFSYGCTNILLRCSRYSCIRKTMDSHSRGLEFERSKKN